MHKNSQIEYAMGNSAAKDIESTQNNEKITTSLDLSGALVINKNYSDNKIANNNDNENKNPELAENNTKIKELVHQVYLSLNKYGYFSTLIPPHKNVTCQACNQVNFVVDRYKCLVCNEYDLCGVCFESRKITAPHVKAHPMVRYSGPKEIFGDEIEGENVTLEKFKKKFDGVEHETTCKGCNSHPIFGLRFKCDECNEFDLCHKCFEKKTEINDHKKEHSILVCYSIRNVNPSDIELLERLGSGAFGTAHKAKIISKNKIVVCKVLEWQLQHLFLGLDVNSLYKSFIREVLAYNEINSNYIIKTYGSCIVNDIKKTKFYLLTEYMEKGSLANLLKNEPDLSYRCRLSIACNIASGMKRIHEKHYIHRDIRPDNIFVNKNYVAKIGDMGIARLQDKFQNHTVIGPDRYMPDEFRTGNYNEKVDVYTFGLTMYHLITGQTHAFENNKVELSEEPIIFSKLIQKCLENVPNDRPTASMLESNLELHYKVLYAVISKGTGYFFLPKKERTKICIKVCNLVSELLFN
ncbi:tyrosine-protein kinase fyna [Hydra vulgaris]|uniref:tyrosine-protein kinase fyna n=1 Tax=Hydra vulgaris TaxID=6087 RepID=UPI0006412C1D|nr:tyrosine-protein kinase fyna-like [Hydra vulgaris]XP_047131754.1 tyrosine-protein kinase fyna-like [Hydra vulgaris]